MVLVKQDGRATDLSIEGKGDFGTFDYDADAQLNLKNSLALQFLVFRIFRNVDDRTEAMNSAVSNFNIAIRMDKTKLVDDESKKTFNKREYKKALKRFITAIGRMKLKDLLALAKGGGYVKNVEVLMPFENLTVNGLEEPAIRSAAMKTTETGKRTGVGATSKVGNVQNEDIARLFLNNEVLVTKNNLDNLLKHIEVSNDEVIFNARKYVFELLEKNNYITGTVDAPKSLGSPVVVNTKGPSAGTEFVAEAEEEELSDEEKEKRRREQRRIQERGEASDYEQTGAEAADEGITDTGDDGEGLDLSGMTDEEIQEARRDINKSEIEKKPEKMLTLVSVKYTGEKFEIRKPDGTTESYDNDTETFDALDRITITKQMVEDALKKESDSYKPFRKLILDTLRPTSGEILVTDRTLLIDNKVNEGGEEKNQGLIKQLLSLKQAEAEEEDKDNPFKDELKRELRKKRYDLDKRIEFLELLARTGDYKKNLFTIYLREKSTKREFFDELDSYKNQVIVGKKLTNKQRQAKKAEIRQIADAIDELTDIAFKGQFKTVPVQDGEAVVPIKIPRIVALNLKELIDKIYEFNKEDLLRTESKNRPTVIPIISVSEIPIEKKARFYVNFNPKKGSRPKQITSPVNLRAKTYDEYPIDVAMKVGSLFDDTVRRIERM